MMEQLGSQVDVRGLYAQWWEGIQMLTPEQQKQIKEYVNELEKQRALIHRSPPPGCPVGIRPGLSLIFQRVASSSAQACWQSSLCQRAGGFNADRSPVVRCS